MPRDINGDLYFGFMAFHALADLTGNERRVAFAILQHYNKRDGRCDPSGERLAALLDMDRTSVVKATARLCKVFGLFEKVSHGGHNHCASYRPQWQRYREIMGEWNTKARPKERAPNVVKTPQSTWRNDHTERGENATQTEPINQIDRYGDSGEGAPGSAPAAPCPEDNPRRLTRSETVQGLLKGSMQRPIAGRSPSHADAARQRAEGRIEADLRSLGLHAHAEAIERMDEATHADAAEAEMARHGAGLALIIERLHLPGGRGPPGGRVESPGA